MFIRFETIGVVAVAHDAVMRVFSWLRLLAGMPGSTVTTAPELDARGSPLMSYQILPSPKRELMAWVRRFIESTTLSRTCRATSARANTSSAPVRGLMRFISRSALISTELPECSRVSGRRLMPESVSGRPGEPRCATLAVLFVPAPTST